MAGFAATILLIVATPFGIGLPAHGEDQARGATLAPCSSAVQQTSCLPGPVLLPGMWITRQVGPIVFTLMIDETVARIQSTVRLRDASITGLVMTAEHPTATFEVIAGEHVAQGSLGVFFCAPPTQSHLLVDFVVEQRVKDTAPVRTQFRGDLAVWESPQRLVLARYYIPLLSDLEARIDLLDSHRPGQTNVPTAQVSFMFGSQLIDTYALSSTSSPVTLRPSSVGPVRIEGGGALFFQPATRQQRGQVRLKADVQSGTAGKSRYDGAIADWSWVEGRADNCRTPW